MTKYMFAVGSPKTSAHFDTIVEHYDLGGFSFIELPVRGVMKDVDYVDVVRELVTYYNISEYVNLEKCELGFEKEILWYLRIFPVNRCFHD